MADQYDELLGAEAPAAPLAPVAVPPGAGGEITVYPSHGGEHAMGAFDGASRFDRAITFWQPSLQSADADILPEKQTIDARARDMLRNDAYVQGGANLHKDNIVGSHYMLNSRPATRSLFGKTDDTFEEEFQEEVEEKFELYADSSDCWLDAGRGNDFTGLIRLGVGVHVAAGEILASVEYLKEPGRPYSTAINMIDLDRLSTDPRSTFEENVRAGIRRDRFGAPVAYQISTRHPRDLMWGRSAMEWKEVPVRKPWGRLQMIHLFEQVRPDQTRGVPEMAAALKEMKITKSFRDITLQNAVTQALYAAAITSDLPSETVFAQLGGNQSPEAVEQAISNYAVGYMETVAKYAGGAKGLSADGVRIPHLFPGTKLDIISPGKGGPLGMEFEQSLLRYIAATLGVSYEQLSRDYTNTNYSSARAAMTETWKFMQARKKVIADRFASIIYRLWLEEALNKGLIDSVRREMKQPGWLYQGQRLDAISRADWIGASRGQIDELKETEAAVLRINNGLSTAEDELARLGKDWRKVYRQIKREQAMRESLNIVFLQTPVSASAQQPTDNPADQRKAS